MHSTNRSVLIGGLAAVVAGIMLIGTSGITFAIGWGLWLAGLVAVLGAVGRPADHVPVATLERAFERAGVGDRRAA